MTIRHPHSPRKKWSPVAVWLVVGGLIVAAQLSYIGFRATQSDTPPKQVGQVVHRDDMTQSFDVSYPVLKAGKVDASLKSFAEKQTDEFVAKIKDQRYHPENKLTLDFSVPHYGKHTLSVIFNEIEEAIGQELVKSRYLLNFDIASGTKLALTDLFRQDSDARGVLATILHDYFRYTKKDELTGEQLKRLQDFTFKNVRDFLLYEDTIVLYLNPKDLGNVKEAQPFAIKKNVLATIMKQQYAEKDASRKPDIKPEPTYEINEIPRPPAPPPVAQGSSGGRIALTFDDGPSAHTGRLLDVLARHNSRATFYVLGHLAQAYSGDLQRMVREGHEIGNHSWLHANLTHLSPDQLEHEIGDTQRAIQAATGGYTPRTYRPPYGTTNGAVQAFCAQYGLNEVLWNVDPSDWQIHNSQIIYDHIMGSAADGRVVLLHDIYGSSVDAAIRAIPDLKARGFQLVTVSELYGY